MANYKKLPTSPPDLSDVELRVSCSEMTVRVRVDREGVIIRAPAIVRKFDGQSIDRLVQWFRKIHNGSGNVDVDVL